MTQRKQEISTDTALACCGMIAAYILLSALAITVAVVDIVGGRTHLALDVFLLVVFGMPYVASRFRSA